MIALCMQSWAPWRKSEIQVRQRQIYSKERGSVFNSGFCFVSIAENCIFQNTPAKLSRQPHKNKRSLSSLSWTGRIQLEEPKEHFESCSIAAVKAIDAQGPTWTSIQENEIMIVTIHVHCRPWSSDNLPPLFYKYVLSYICRNVNF